MLLSLAAAFLAVAASAAFFFSRGGGKDGAREGKGVPPLLACVRNRRSVFPRDYAEGAEPVSREEMGRLLEASMWAPFHGSVPPWRFVVLGKGGARHHRILRQALARGRLVGRRNDRGGVPPVETGEAG